MELKMEVRELKNLYEKGNHQEFLDQYYQLEKQNLLSSFSTEEQLYYIYYQIQVLIRLNQYDKALSQASQARTKFSDLNEKHIMILLLVIQIKPLISLGQLKKAENLCAEGDDILNSLTNDEQVEKKKEIAIFLFSKAQMYNAKGDHNIALKYAEQCLSIRESLGNNYEKMRIIDLMGGIYWQIGELDVALSYLQQIPALNNSIGNQ